MRKIRILLLNYEFPPLGGGAATASAEIARHLVRRGVEVAVLTSHFKGLPRKEERDGYTIYRVPAMRRNIDRCSVPEMAAYIAGAALPALRLASSFKPDLMHVFFGMPTGPVGLLVNQLKGIPYLLSLRGDDVPGRQEGSLALAHRTMKPLTKQVWSRASKLVVNGEGLLKRAKATLPGASIELVPNGIDLDVFQPGDKAVTEQSDRSTVRLLFVGRLHSQKGLSHLLQALAHLGSPALQRVQLDLVGSGPAEEELHALAGRLGLTRTVRFHSWAPRSEIARYYQEADLFVFPSHEEGMPNVVLEAMACGLPVIASDIPGVRGLVHDRVNGLLVPPADSLALARALNVLIADDLLRHYMGHESSEFATSYDWAGVADSYLALSRQIIQPRKAETPEDYKGHLTTRSAYRTGDKL
ncbi:MAG: glycosyltransferase family 4 protein [Chloroflexi bacterium]|nr:glycosyltransferase family 4 protein [Chloroflexota bacterium]